jgi:microcystin-dependent protein
VSSNGSRGDGGGGISFHITPGEGQQVALTEDEQKMVAKLLGDPTYFPIEFRRWLEDFLDNSDFKISQSQIMGGGAGGGSSNPSLLPAGIILPYACTVIGKDCLICNGAKVSRTDYKELFDAIGTAWGSGDGSTTFTLPDLRDRALYGIGSVVSLAQTDGKSTGNRGGPYHHHTVVGNTGSAGAHGHNLGSASDHSHGPGFLANLTNFSLGAGGVGVTAGSGTYGQTSPGGAHGHSLSSAPDHQHSLNALTSGGYDLDKPSFAGIQYAITTGRSQIVSGS